MHRKRIANFFSELFGGDDDRIDSVIDSAQTTIKFTHTALDLVPAPRGLGSAVDILLQILDKVKVRSHLFSIFVCLHVLEFVALISGCKSQ